MTDADPPNPQTGQEPSPQPSPQPPAPDGSAAPADGQPTDNATATVEPITLSIDAVIDPSINFAALHNDVPAVKQLTLTHAAGPDAEDLELRLWVDRDLSGVWTHRLQRLGAGQSLTLNNIDLPLSAQALAHITERDSADLHAQVRCGGAVIAEKRWPIDALAFDEWEGLRSLPELLAAFVTPNHPAVQRLLGDACLHLERMTGDRSLSGYQRKDPARVLAMAQAIYHAVGDLGLSYINPPASFENAGQRVRLPDQLIERRMGTCLDLTLLLAAMFEQAGLHPLVVMLKGHAFVGLWLSEERFPEPAVAEPLRLRKRVQLDEIIVLETTGLTHAPTMAFETARLNAAKQLEDPGRFHYAVDLRAARSRQIRPLPLRVKPGTYDLIDLDGAQARSLSDQPDDAAASTAAALEQPAGPAQDLAIDVEPDVQGTARLEHWKRKLLDLSLRNRVLNYRETKKTIPLEVPDLPGFEDKLADGKAFDILPKTDLMDGSDPRSAELHEQRSGEDARQRFLHDEVQVGRLRADLTERELDKRLVEIYRAARLGMEESGANTLFLAFGLLNWYETSTSQPARLAPILLIPATLERLPAGRGYKLTAADEDPQINVTLLEKLRSEYGIDTAGLEELTEDETGLDVGAILRRFREAVKDIERWDVLDRVALGLFSFNKFLMWRDLHERSASLTARPVVRRLIDPDYDGLDVDRPLPDPADLDTTRRPDQTLCPMDADSSQLAAVFAAEEGHSFVLEGPPGTGKSQTITNLIAHALSRGKRVLFVSEKRAALEVVHRRLEKIGLGPFCLELHSNKANKRAVLAQLGEALDLGARHAPSGWQQLADQLHETRTKMNTVVKAMHQEHPVGLSVYRATSELVTTADTPRIDLSLQAIGKVTRDRLNTMHSAVQRLADAAPAVGSVDQHPYRAAGTERYTADLPEKLLNAITPAEEAVEQVNATLSAVLKRFGLERVTAAELSDDAMRWLTDLGALLAEPYRPTPKLLTEPGFDAVHAAVSEQVELGKARDAERAKLLERYDERIFNASLGELRGQLAEGMTALPVISWFKCYSPKKRLKLCLRPGSSLPSGAALLDELDKLIRARDWSMQLASESNPGCIYAGAAWDDGEAHWDQVLELLDWADRLRQHLQQPAADLVCGEDKTEHLLRLAIDQREQASDSATASALSALCDALSELDTRLATLNTLMHADADHAWGAPYDAGRLDTIANTLEAWRSDPGLLRDWAHWCSVRSEAEALGLSALISAHAGRAVPASRLCEVFRKSFLTQWHAHAIASEPALAEFHRLDTERQIEQFRAIDQRYLQLTAEQVQADLAERLPLRDTDANANSEVGLLRRQIKLKRRHMPVRKLIASLPNLLPRLKPCLLMSPLSVAQYLDTAGSQGAADPANEFDLVVFDEASQIPVWDAVGALARGGSCVVVGDSKQLPPTSFFQKLESDEDVPDENDFVELESILDECSASGLPSMRLLWHYRSRHESLIAFSNAHYYDHRLNTFPSPCDENENLGVTLKPIEGVYDRGESCTNPAEAQALVADVVARLKAADQDSYRSVGVVTFSMAQQTLIEDLLDQARREHPAIEVFFTDAVGEPVFVKNLENVQGDERAAIYFSVCYGPDASGKVAMNFGPLNREGGERRLNVAVTRAREQVVVYSSLPAEQIDLSRTQAIGVAHLRGFLEYAERGAKAIAQRATQAQPSRPGPIAEALAQRLRERGHKVDLNVGLSGYRVALGVRNPNEPGAYLLGIELDGAIYHSAATARDRERTRPAVMKGLGWRLHRVWALDVLHDLDAELLRIEEAIDKAEHGEAFEPIKHELPPLDENTGIIQQSITNRGDGMSVYEPFVPSKPEGDADAYYNPAKSGRVRKTLLKIAKREAPIHEDLLAKRLTLAWQVGRLTSKAAERAAAIIDQAQSAGEVKRVGRFVWLAEQDPEHYGAYRVPADDDDAARDIEEVPTQELEQAAFAVLRRTIAIPREDLQREVAELFGLSRLTPRVQPVIDEAVQSMLDSGRCIIDAAGKVTLP